VTWPKAQTRLRSEKGTQKWGGIPLDLRWERTALACGGWLSQISLVRQKERNKEERISLRCVEPGRRLSLSSLPVWEPTSSPLFTCQPCRTARTRIPRWVITRKLFLKKKDLNVFFPWRTITAAVMSTAAVFNWKYTGLCRHLCDWPWLLQQTMPSPASGCGDPACTRCTQSLSETTCCQRYEYTEYLCASMCVYTIPFTLYLSISRPRFFYLLLWSRMLLPAKIISVLTFVFQQQTHIHMHKYTNTWTVIIDTNICIYCTNSKHSHVSESGSYMTWGSTFPCDWQCIPCEYIRELESTASSAAKAIAQSAASNVAASDNAAKISGFTCSPLTESQ